MHHRGGEYDSYSNIQRKSTILEKVDIWDWISPLSATQQGLGIGIPLRGHSSSYPPPPLPKLTLQTAAALASMWLSLDVLQ